MMILCLQEMLPGVAAPQMGRKKAKRAAPKKASRAKLEKAFACPFCNHESTIECKMYVIIHDVLYTLVYFLVIEVDRSVRSRVESVRQDIRQ